MDPDPAHQRQSGTSKDTRIRPGRIPLQPYQVNAYLGLAGSDDSVISANSTLTEKNIEAGAEPLPPSPLVMVHSDKKRNDAATSSQRTSVHNQTREAAEPSSKDESSQSLVDDNPADSPAVASSESEVRPPSPLLSRRTDSTLKPSPMSVRNPSRDSRREFSVDVTGSCFNRSSFGSTTSASSQAESRRTASTLGRSSELTSVASERPSSEYNPARGSPEFSLDVSGSIFDDTLRGSTTATSSTAPSLRSSRAPSTASDPTAEVSSRPSSDFSPAAGQAPAIETRRSAAASSRPSTVSFAYDLDVSGSCFDNTRVAHTTMNTRGDASVRSSAVHSVVANNSMSLDEHAYGDVSASEYNPADESAPSFIKACDFEAAMAAKRSARRSFANRTADVALGESTAAGGDRNADVHAAKTPDIPEKSTVDDSQVTDAASAFDLDATGSVFDVTVGANRTMRQSVATRPSLAMLNESVSTNADQDADMSEAKTPAVPDKSMRGEQDESTDTSKPLDLDATVSVVEPTRRADRTSITVPSKEDEDEVSAMEVDDDNVEQGNAADETGPVSRNHQKPTAMAASSDVFNATATAAASRKSTAYPAFSQARAQNTQLSKFESKTAQVRKSLAVGGARCSVFAHRQQQFAAHTPSPSGSRPKNPIPLRSALRPSHVVPFRKPGHLVGAEDKRMGPHRGLGLPRQSIALRNIAEEYDSSSSMNLGRVRKTMSLEETRVSCSKGYVKSPGSTSMLAEGGRLNAFRKKSKRRSIDLQRFVHQRNMYNQTSSTMQSPVASASTSLIDATIARSGPINRPRPVSLRETLDPHHPKPYQRKKGEARLRFSGASSSADESAAGDDDDRSPAVRAPPAKSWEQLRQQPLLDYDTSTTYDETAAGGALDVTGLAKTRAPSNRSSSRSGSQLSDIDEERHKDEGKDTPDGTLHADDERSRERSSAGSSLWGEKSAMSFGLGKTRVGGNSPPPAAIFDDTEEYETQRRSERAHSSNDVSLFTTDGDDESRAASCLNTPTPFRPPASALPRHMRSMAGLGSAGSILSPASSSGTPASSSASSPAIVHFVAPEAEKEEVKILTPKIRTRPLRRTKIVDCKDDDVEEETAEGLPVRRSNRNRVPRLNHAYGQHALYKKDADGNSIMVGVSSVTVKDPTVAKTRTLNTAEALTKLKGVAMKRAVSRKERKNRQSVAHKKQRVARRRDSEDE